MKHIKVYQLRPELLQDDLALALVPYSSDAVKITSKLYEDRYYKCVSEFDINHPDIDEILTKVFGMGNDDSDIMPDLYRSMSPGDIIEVDDDKYLVMPIGFNKL